MDNIISNVILINVKDFGAKGDGITDDSIAIQNAYDNVKNTGGIVFFPRGEYIISMTREDKIWDGYGQLNCILRTGIMVKGNNIITRGEDPYNTIIKMYPSNYRESREISGLLSSVFTLECALDTLGINQSNIKFENIQLDGGRGKWNQPVLDKDYMEDHGSPGEVGTHAKGINARTCGGKLNNLIIKNCIIQNMYAEGTYSNKATNSLIEDTIFSYNRPAGGNLSGSVTYKNCTFKKHYAFNIEHAHSEGDPGANYLKIIGCKFYDLDTLTHTHIGSFYVAPDKNTGLFILEDSEFFLEDETRDVKYSMVNLDGYNNVIIKNNKIKTKCDEGHGIVPVIIKNCKNVNIDGNYIDSNSPIYWFTSKTGCSFNITNNKYGQNVQKEFTQILLNEAFGSNFILNHENNEFEDKSIKESLSLNPNTDNEIFFSRMIPLVGKHKIIADFSNNITITELYYIEPIEYGGDAKKHIIVSDFEVEAGNIYKFEFEPVLKLNKLIHPASGIKIIMRVDNHSNLNCRII